MVNSYIKNFCLVVGVLLFATQAHASNWVEVGSKIYIDASTIKTDRQYVYAWFKLLNPGTWDLDKGKEIYYIKTYNLADCSKNRLMIISSILYDLNEISLGSYNFNFRTPEYYLNEWTDVPPDTVGEMQFKSMCAVLGSN